MTTIQQASLRLRQRIQEASDGLIGRERLVELVVLAAVASEHLLVIGPPGTAKSAAVRRISQLLGGSYFEYLLGRFTEPTELFGPVDISKLRDGRVEVQTSGMLPEAHVAFLDEVFRGSTAILNTLLTLLNERTFRHGHTRMSCPLRVCVGASNGLPEDDALAAFADRFLLHVFVEPTGDSSLEALLEGGWRASTQSPPRGNDLDALDVLTAAASRADPSVVRAEISQAVRLLRSADVELSDRRIVNLQRLVIAAALLDGRENPSTADLWPVVYAIPTRAGQETALEALRDLLDGSRNETLPHASEEASHGMAARAQRIVATGRTLLDTPPPDEEQWLLKLEGLAREIDASFSLDDMPGPVARLRKQLVAKLADQD